MRDDVDVHRSTGAASTRQFRALNLKGTPMTRDRTTVPANSITRYVVYAAPLLWAVLILFHPMPGGDSPYTGISDDVDVWLVVHVGQLILTPFLFLAVWRLLDGLSSVAATISRCALVVWTVFFSAYDAVQGIATGVFVDHANGLAGTDQSAVADAIDHLVIDNRLAGDISAIQMVAGGAWLTVAIAAAVALHQAHAGTAVVAAAALSVVFSMHVTPAAIGLLALFAAGVLHEHRRTRPARRDPAGPSDVEPPARLGV